VFKDRHRRAVVFAVVAQQAGGDLLVPVVGLLLVFWFANFLYRKQIFLRL
jgi:hypothetical protein